MQEHPNRYLVEACCSSKQLRRRLRKRFAAHGFAVGKTRTDKLNESLSGQEEADCAAVLGLKRKSFTLTHAEFPGTTIRCVADRIENQLEHIDKADTGSTLRYTEITLSLDSGCPRLLSRARRVLAEEPALYAARMSRAERKFAAGSNAGSHHLGEEADWTAIAYRVLNHDLQRLILSEPYAWEGLSGEGVHQMRVTTRQLRAHLTLFSGYCGKRRARRTRTELKALGSVLGKVRDDDVHRAQLEELETAASIDTISQLKGRNSVHRQRHLRRLRKHLKTHFETTIRDLRSLKLKERQAAANDGGKAVRGNSRSPYAQLARSLDQCLNMAQADTHRPEHLHRLRKALKKAAYQLDILVQLSTRLTGLRQSTRHLQSLLGQFQDRRIAQQNLTIVSMRTCQPADDIAAVFDHPDGFWSEYEAARRQFVEQVEYLIPYVKSRAR